MALELFHFKAIDGTDHTLPKTLSAGLLRKVRGEDNEMNMMFSLVELVADESALAALDEMDLALFATTIKSWMQGATAPNSPSSSK